MKNRNHAFPILCAVVLSLAVPPLVASPTSVSTEIAKGPVTQQAAVATTPTATTPVAATATPALPPHTASYTVVKGDSLTSLANKFNTTRKKLVELNNLPDYKIAPGQSILIPSYKKTPKTASVTDGKTGSSAKTKPKHYAAAQPVQDFDIPASTFASCPPPPVAVEDDDKDSDPAVTVITSKTPITADKSPKYARLVSPAELEADSAAQAKIAAAAQAKADAAAAAAKPAPPMTRMAITPQLAPRPIASTASLTPRASSTMTTTAAPRSSSSNTTTAFTSKLPPATLTSTSTSKPASRGLFSFLGSNSTQSTPSSAWGDRFIRESRLLGDQGIGYDDSWRPPGESHAWAMDCSNTSRYIYKKTANINLPRTASDQYYYLHLQGKAWDVPTDSLGLADGEYLRKNLKPGDLLFWENTYRPERQPPITHVMIFLGTNAQGQWIMAGSQGSRGGEHNRRNGGPDIYVFRPSAPCGGYTAWFVHHKGRFCAFGRPLEADPSKLAAND